MLYHFFYWLTDGREYAYHSPLFRATMAVIVGFLVVWLAGPRVIRTLVRLKVGDRPEFDHEALNRLTQSKRNTPTMGGILIVAAVIIATLLLADLGSFYVQMGLFCLIWLGVLGGTDD